MINIYHNKLQISNFNHFTFATTKNWTMTFSILTFDPTTKTLAGASATGSLCVGGWVLLADSCAGISASQGARPSTLWGEDVIGQMANGVNAADAVENVVAADEGRNYRQLAALDTKGVSGIFSGTENLPVVDHIVETNLVLAGNILRSDRVLPTMKNRFMNSTGEITNRLIDTLEAGFEVGGDRRGIMSASILLVNPAFPPLTLRIDYHEAPLQALRTLLAKTQELEYQNWLRQLPTRTKS